MDVRHLRVQSFRNIENIEIEPSRGVNVIYGENAQGKTNLLESIWMFTGCRSFRGAKDKELIEFHNKRALLSMDFYGEGREQSAEIEISENRKFTLNGVKLKGASKMMGNFLSVVFSPVHLSLVKDGPYERRRFLDIAISQLKPNYAVTLSQYNKALSQRNMLLKDIQYHSELYDTLDIWEDRLAFFASEILRQRISYTEKLSSYSTEIYAGISSKKEELRLSYHQGTLIEGRNRNELYENMKLKLSEQRQADLITGFTSVGPHRDDLSIDINKLAARSYGSQGQQRSAALALKLGEAAVIKNFSDEQPVALLDDVMSELDTGRQNYILNHIENWQVFITCCDPSTVRNLYCGKMINIERGKLCI